MNGLVTRTFSGTVSADAMSVAADQLAAAIAAGAVVVDIRSQHTRNTAGVITGALAIDQASIIDRLTPDGPASLRRAARDAAWIVVSDDGYDAEWVTWHLRALGASGVRFLIGGFGALRAGYAIGATSHTRREVAAISAH